MRIVFKCDIYFILTKNRTVELVEHEGSFVLKSKFSKFQPRSIRDSGRLAKLGGRWTSASRSGIIRATLIL